MVKEIQYTSIRRVLDNLLDHPMLRDVTLEQAVRYAIRFIGIHGYPKLYQDKIEEIDIHEFRGMLPCDLISIIQVRDMKSKICLRDMTDNFTPGMAPHSHKHFHHQEDKGGHRDLLNNVVPSRWYLPHLKLHEGELAFKTHGRVIYTSFPEGRVEIAYKAIPVDEDGFPLLIDNENYLAALEAYIKKQVFTVKYDSGKISAGVLQNAQTEYAWLAGELDCEMVLPSTSEFESISRSLTHLIPRVREFDKGFRHLGDREYVRRH